MNQDGSRQAIGKHNVKKEHSQKPRVNPAEDSLIQVAASKFTIGADNSSAYSPAVTAIKNLVHIAKGKEVSHRPGVVGGFFTVSAIPGWYATLEKPALNPPGWIFGPVWVTLYFLMGVSLWLIWKSNSSQKKRAVSLFAVQLVLNAIWSPVFFGAHSISSALAIIVLLWAAILLTILIFKKISKSAAWLLVPYIIWVSFAVYLNYSLWVLN